MNEEKQPMLRMRMDAEMRPVRWTENDRQAVRQRIEGGKEIMRRKISMGMVLAAAVMLMAVTALAAGLVYSSRADATLLADRALEEGYGITPAMQTYFYRTVEEQDGATVVSYTGLEDFAGVLGKYTVTVKNGSAAAAWSHDGEPQAGFDGAAWGAAELAEMLGLTPATHGVTNYVEKAQAVTSVQGESAGEVGENDSVKDEEAAVRALCRLDEAAMENLAREAVAASYGLTEEQAAQLECHQDIPEYAYYGYTGEAPCYHVWLYLTQAADGVWTEKDGIYVVDVNVETGVIENILYDSGLGSNG